MSWKDLPVILVLVAALLVLVGVIGLLDPDALSHDYRTHEAALPLVVIGLATACFVA